MARNEYFTDASTAEHDALILQLDDVAGPDIHGRTLWNDENGTRMAIQKNDDGYYFFSQTPDEPEITMVEINPQTTTFSAAGPAIRSAYDSLRLTRDDAARLLVIGGLATHPASRGKEEFVPNVVEKAESVASPVDELWTTVVAIEQLNYEIRNDNADPSAFGDGEEASILYRNDLGLDVVDTLEYYRTSSGLRLPQLESETFIPETHELVSSITYVLLEDGLAQVVIDPDTKRQIVLEPSHETLEVMNDGLKKMLYKIENYKDQA